MEEPLINLADESICSLGEKLKAMNLHDTYGLDAFEMCLVPVFVIPLKFKVPNFERYRGIGFPKTHLRAYWRKMAAYSNNNKLLIYTNPWWGVLKVVCAVGKKPHWDLVRTI